MTWERGRTEIERLLADGELERVAPSTPVAARLLDDARAHVRLASKGVDDDPAGALQLAYDAARKACAALLAVQGLRATTRGGHIAVIDSVRAQFNDRGGLEVFGRLHALRRRRNRTEYPDLDSPGNRTRRRTPGHRHRTSRHRRRRPTARERTPRHLRIAPVSPTGLEAARADRALTNLHGRSRALRHALG